MIKSARALFDAIGENIADQFPRMLLRGDQGTGFAPSQYGSVELHSANVLSIKTATAETKGVIAGVGSGPRNLDRCLSSDSSSPQGGES